MKTTENITVTNGRLKKALTTQIEPLIIPKVSKQITKAVNDNKIHAGVLTKFYPYLDKAEVTVNNEKILCKILHRFAGDLIDFYTPKGDNDYCDELKEPCIIPQGEIECLVLDINDNSDEQILLGYIFSEEIIELNPAKEGNLKLASISGTNQYWIKFGAEGLDLRLPETPITNVGHMDDEMEEISNVNSNNFYSKQEVDKMIEDLRNEFLGDQG